MTAATQERTETQHGKRHRVRHALSRLTERMMKGPEDPRPVKEANARLDAIRQPLDTANNVGGRLARALNELATLNRGPLDPNRRGSPTDDTGTKDVRRTYEAIRGRHDGTYSFGKNPLRDMTGELSGLFPNKTGVYGITLERTTTRTRGDSSDVLTVTVDARNDAEVGGRGSHLDTVTFQMSPDGTPLVEATSRGSRYGRHDFGYGSPHGMEGVGDEQLDGLATMVESHVAALREQTAMPVATY